MSVQGHGRKPCAIFFWLSEEVWGKLEPHLPKKQPDGSKKLAIQLDTRNNLATAGFVIHSSYRRLRGMEMDQRSLFGLSEHLERISKIGDPLEVLEATVDSRLRGTSFEYFRGWLVEGLGYGDGAKGGRPPFDPVSMFKALILQAQHNRSEAKMEFMIRDRLSWMRFLKFDLSGPTPDENKGPAVAEQTHRDRDAAACDESLRLAAADEGLPPDVRTDRRRHSRPRAQAAQQ